MREKLGCKPFGWYAARFKNRALCLPGERNSIA